MNILILTKIYSDSWRNLGVWVWRDSKLFQCLHKSSALVCIKNCNYIVWTNKLLTLHLLICRMSVMWIIEKNDRKHAMEYMISDWASVFEERYNTFVLGSKNSSQRLLWWLHQFYWHICIFSYVLCDHP